MSELFALGAALCIAVSGMLIGELKGRVDVFRLARWQMLAALAMTGAVSLALGGWRTLGQEQIGLLAASSLFAVNDPDGDTITRYQFWDETTDANSGRFTVNGVAQAARTLVDVSAGQLSQVSFVTGNGVADAIQMRAFDGTAWSAVSGNWAPFSIIT